MDAILIIHAPSSSEVVAHSRMLVTPRPATSLGVQVIMFAYSDVVCRRVFDTIPKHVHLYLVNGVCDGFVSWMLDNVDKTDLRKWLAEDASTQRTRREKERKLAQFEEAVQILRDMPPSTPNIVSNGRGGSLPASP